MKKGIGWVLTAAVSILLLFISSNQEEQTFAPVVPADEILNVPHRGASAYAPEHTIVSYELGQQMSGDYVEIDLQMTKDGELIAMHDDTLERTTGESGDVSAYTLAEIKQMDAGSWFNDTFPSLAQDYYEQLTIPTLEELFLHFGTGVRYYIEIKSPRENDGIEEKLLQMMDAHNISSKDVLIQSFSVRSLKNVQRLNEDISLVQLLRYDQKARMTKNELEAYKQYAIGIGANYEQLHEEYVHQVRQNGLELHAYTVNKKEDMHRLLDWGVTGIFTNYPDRLREVLEQRE
ncbi:glycerophosphodiester phosphodiesterase [Pontibacillus litoralis]|uniref:Glycerophosphoryl diester phosphodiesterase n=1 Tax=Pontibacillus litoralis JSM 072002 TaxID=1385512 RepID=A0A0A5G008_9BACI|nr:glycerophosphodiester phosphodiesterase [Pontibacillus litoralis]KGX84418.1 glycerophosphoryl diester phosphodiesterase [Pontibacillus litoralis JSM 072002]